MDRVIQGGPAANFFRTVGRLGLGLGQQANVIGRAIGVGAGGAAGYALGDGPGAAAGAAAAPAVGWLAQMLSAGATRRQAKLARALVATGQGLPRANPALSRLVEEWARRGARIPPATMSAP